MNAGIERSIGLPDQKEKEILPANIWKSGISDKRGKWAFGKVH